MTDWRKKYLEYRSLDDTQKISRFLSSLELSEREPYEDVYEAALAFRITQGSPENWYYRGQRKVSWDVIPSLLREPSGIDIDFEIRRLSSAVRFVQSELKVPENIAQAIVQHYSDVPDEKIRTWLIDVTRSPEVAFFFASLGGQTGETGVVYCFDENEMESLGSSTSKQIGKIKIISPDGVPRIKNQNAAFIDYSHPVLLEGYSPFRWKFKQHENTTFEYPELGVTRDNLLGKDDKYVELLSKWEEEIWPEETPPRDHVTPEHNPFDELTQEDYFVIVKDWLKKFETQYQSVSKSEKESIKSLCEVHVRLRNDRGISGSIDNEHALKRAIELAIASADIHGHPIDFNNLMKYYRMNTINNQENFKSIVQSVQPDYDFE